MEQGLPGSKFKYIIAMIADELRRPFGPRVNDNEPEPYSQVPYKPLGMMMIDLISMMFRSCSVVGDDNQRKQRDIA